MQEKRSDSGKEHSGTFRQPGGVAMNCCRGFVLVGGLALALGALLPWVSWTCASSGECVRIAGIESGGYVSGGIGLLLVGLALTKQGRPGRRYSLTGIGLGTVAVTLMLDILFTTWRTMASQMAKPGEPIAATLGVGIILSVLGALLAEGGALLRVAQPGERTFALLKTARPVA